VSDCPSLLSQFEQQNGYNLMVDLLLRCNYRKDEEQRQSMMDAIYQIAFFGQMRLESTTNWNFIEADAPFQHADFRIPISKSSKFYSYIG
jgi:hypothetical protein